MTDFTKLDPAEWHRVRTRDGRKVRILCTDGPDQSPIVALVDGVGSAYLYDREGYYFGDKQEDDDDLILQPEPRVVWLRVYLPWGARAEEGKDKPTNDGTRHTDYRITLVDGQPPKIEEVE